MKKEELLKALQLMLGLLGLEKDIEMIEKYEKATIEDLIELPILASKFEIVLAMPMLFTPEWLGSAYSTYKEYQIFIKDGEEGTLFAFLLGHNALQEYVDNTDIEVMVELHTKPTEQWILGSFDWEASPEKEEFWKDIHMKWIDYIATKKVRVSLVEAH